MTTHTLIVRRGDGTIESIMLSNGKSRSKSIEQGELWIVDPGTGRVLPYLGGGRRFDSFALHPGIATTPDWYETTVTGELGSPAPDTAGGAGDTTAKGVADTASPAPVATGTAGPAGNTPAASVAGAFDFLGTLTSLIAERRTAMPEGSYTTHLFTKGESKIRKKTGEEAVELVLAEDNAEILSEASDLIYHLMVFLEVRGLSLAEVVVHLRERHGR